MSAGNGHTSFSEETPSQEAHEDGVVGKAVAAVAVVAGDHSSASFLSTAVMRAVAASLVGPGVTAPGGWKVRWMPPETSA